MEYISPNLSPIVVLTMKTKQPLNPAKNVTKDLLKYQNVTVYLRHVLPVNF